MGSDRYLTSDMPREALHEACRSGEGQHLRNKMSWASELQSSEVRVSSASGCGAGLSVSQYTKTRAPDAVDDAHAYSPDLQRHLY